MDYQTAENQAMLLQQQANQVSQELRNLADKLQARVPDQNLSRELMLDLRQVALAIQQQNQSALSLIQQMAEYIHVLESNLGSQQYQQMPPIQPRGWAQQSYAGTGGGFMGNLVSGLGIGAGMGLGEDLVDSIFGRW